MVISRRPRLTGPTCGAVWLRVGLVVAIFLAIPNLTACAPPEPTCAERIDEWNQFLESDSREMRWWLRNREIMLIHLAAREGETEATEERALEIWICYRWHPYGTDEHMQFGLLQNIQFDLSNAARVNQAVIGVHEHLTGSSVADANFLSDEEFIRAITHPEFRKLMHSGD